ncbi:MAG: alpha-2-macroglobulin, partial [Flavobacteriales bacterium]|nr:alpha-2-macroglobulin [Flavobacteriales bacterium]
ELTNTGEPGENAQIIVSSNAKDAKVLCEVESDDKIIKRYWLKLNQNQQLVEFPIKEEYRGGLVFHFTSVNKSRAYSHKSIINVPFTNKKLDISFETFRDKLLPGQKEQWKLKIKGKTGDKIMAEMLATMYDASLDAFASNQLSLDLYQGFYSRLYWDQYNSFAVQSSQQHSKGFYEETKYVQPLYYNRLNWFGYYTYTGYYNESFAFDGWYQTIATTGAITRSTSKSLKNSLDAQTNLPMSANQAIAGEFAATEEIAKADVGGASMAHGRFGKAEGEDRKSNVGGKKRALGQIKARSNFNETAFFFPQLTTDEAGSIVVNFEVPESLTKWKFLGLAHTKDLKVGTIQEEIITQKDLMVFPNAPRFLRQGDKITISSKVSNISKKPLSGSCQLFLINPFTNESVDAQFKNVNAQKTVKLDSEGSKAVEWELTVPDDFSAVAYKVVAEAGDFTDGEENSIPILTNRMLVTESMPLPIRSNESKKFKFNKLLNYDSKTLKNHKLTLEFTSNPAWYAIQAMPYMMEYPYECTEQTFTRYYSNSIATEIMNSNPKIKTIVDAWGNQSPESFLSKLQKNQELKSLILEETPWVLQAKNEEQRKRRISVLFDLNRMSNEMRKAFKKVKEAQTPNGGWTWFPGMRDSRYITTHIITGFGHLDKLGIKSVRENYETFNMIQKGVRYLDARIVEDYREIKKNDKDYLKNQHIGYSQIQYLYARSFFGKIPLSKTAQTAHDYFMKQAEEYWLEFNNYAQGMIALAHHRRGTSKTGIHIEHLICESLKQRAIKHEELGMYWKGMMDGGYYWYQAPIETQALMIETFNEINNDIETVENLKVWLLKQKQVNDWKTTKATANACYALFMNGVDLLDDNQKVDITIGNEKIVYQKNESSQDRFVETEPGTNYFKTSWNGSEIKRNQGNITVTKNTSGVAWGALYWQYFEDLDKIESHETPLKLKKDLFIEVTTKTGKKLIPIKDQKVKIGDKVIVRIELQVDRNMEYVHMKDLRASGFEPINVLSRYKWQDGLGYYESTKDAATNFFFDYLPRGTFVFEYPLRASHSGDFSNGITSIQCMYAPEFTSHSEGIRVSIDQ